MSNRNKARELATRHGLNVRQARYEKDEKWYHPLVDFPAAFFDPNGYIAFQTAEDYRSCSYLRFGQDVHVKKGGISSIPGYKRFDAVPITATREIRQGDRGPITTSGDNDLQFPEGAIEELIVELKRRDPKLRALAARMYGTACQVCSFDFGRFYGEQGIDYFEIHHIKPLSLDRSMRKSTVADVAVVCANCHRMLHRRGRQALPIEQLTAVIRKGANISLKPTREPAAVTRKGVGRAA